MARSKANPYQLPTLRLVKALPVVIHLRPKRPLAERIKAAGNSLAVLEDVADWAELSEMLFGEGDRRLVPEETERVGNVIPIRQRSSSAEIAAVRISEERRGKRR